MRHTLYRITERLAAWLASGWVVLAILPLLLLCGVVALLTGQSNHWQLFVTTPAVFVAILLLLLTQHRRHKDLRSIKAKLEEIETLVSRTASVVAPPKTTTKRSMWRRLLRTPPSQN